MGTRLGGIAATAAEAFCPLYEDESPRCAVNQILKSVVRESAPWRTHGL
ncbi:hypothetical protein [Candidatus Hakubella thermalkaliphila]|nr:hypothetical protein [Candidatus Hakubella thermalkaliphila]